MKLWALIVAFLSFVLDRITKSIAGKFLYGKSISILPGFFNLRYAENKGAAFSIFSSSGDIVRKIFLLFIPAVIIAFILYYILFKSIKSRLFAIGLGLILGGAVGNLYDRVLYGKVIDFLDFYIGPYHWPTFNIADVSVFVGCFLLLIHHFKEE
ncbi:Lipoprotein signal peptidase [Desulfurobacterium thermolithotrophum DSM 11699]|uniref:Lipoprotein signal peptidase n=1 Tax=Desulfurobacterium thermolithotrophum (strain DSM 11699 / BSA) TaxID=868864 RepID=F0S3T0_DESTD|nr:signal peptidase II [Desulfurobacterium thermolithotrophum]ADY73502.1 Lipoprotein signal peptidase [Desulfurobacterium thermolithotrophum DSM 11699]